MAQKLKEKTGISIDAFRKADHPIDRIFLERWSPRAFSGESFTEEEVMSLFEAGRWAPSSYNSQPWRFIYALRDTPEWNVLMDLLVDFNKQWAKNAGLLIVFISRRNFEWNGEPAPTHSFDAGAAWENMALQAAFKGWAAHGMQGFDYEKARKILNIPQEYAVDAMAAVGKPGRKEDLPEGMREREFPSGRKPVSEIIMKGRFHKTQGKT